MVILNAHFDGKAIVPDEPSSLQLKSGTRLKVTVEPIQEPGAAAVPVLVFQSLDIEVDPAVSNAIALDAEFDIEES